MLVKNIFTGIIAVIAGIIILVNPNIVAWVIGLFLILVGILKIFGRI